MRTPRPTCRNREPIQSDPIPASAPPFRPLTWPPEPAGTASLAALLASGAPVYDDPATSGRRLSLDRAGFTKLLHEAAVGDTIRIADAARLFRSVADILALRPVQIRRGKGYSIRLTMPLELHHAALQQSPALAAEGAGPAERKAHRVYATRITAAQQQRTPGKLTTPPRRAHQPWPY